MTDKKLAKDVARELDRRQRRRKLLILAAIVGALILAFFYLRCGRGWGLGGEGKGKGEGKGSGTGSVVATTPDAGLRRCALRVDAEGIMLDGEPSTQADAVSTCARVGGADVIVTGEAMQGTWELLRAALDAAHVPVYLQSK